MFTDSSTTHSELAVLKINTEEPMSKLALPII